MYVIFQYRNEKLFSQEMEQSPLVGDTICTRDTRYKVLHRDWDMTIPNITIELGEPQLF